MKSLKCECVNSLLADIDTSKDMHVSKFVVVKGVLISILKNDVQSNRPS